MIDLVLLLFSAGVSLSGCGGVPDKPLVSLHFEHGGCTVVRKYVRAPFRGPPSFRTSSFPQIAAVDQEENYSDDRSPGCRRAAVALSELDFLFPERLDAVERNIRLRELRVLIAVYCGWDSPAKQAIDRALSGESEIAALEEIGKLPALRRRRLLASYGALRNDAIG